MGIVGDKDKYIFTLRTQLSSVPLGLPVYRLPHTLYGSFFFFGYIVGFFFRDVGSRER